MYPGRLRLMFMFRPPSAAPLLQPRDWPTVSPQFSPLTNAGVFHPAKIRIYSLVHHFPPHRLALLHNPHGSLQTPPRATFSPVQRQCFLVSSPLQAIDPSPCCTHHCPPPTTFSPATPYAALSPLPPEGPPHLPPGPGPTRALEGCRLPITIPRPACRISPHPQSIRGASISQASPRLSKSSFPTAVYCLLHRSLGPYSCDN